MTRRLFAALALVFVSAAPAVAVGPVVGTNCVATWIAVTKNTDGSAVTGVVTYNVYVAAGVQTAPLVAPKLTGLTTTTAAPCTGLAAGQYTAWVSAVETPTPGGSSSESVVSTATPFVLVSPETPTSVNVR